MKTIYLFLTFSVAFLTFTSCSNEVKEELTFQDEQTETLDSVFTYDMYFDAEITPYDGATRTSNATDWEDGDVVYIYFSGGNNTVYGKAEYISSSKMWRVTSGKALESISNATCYVWYGKGAEPETAVDNNMSCYKYTYMSEAYHSSGSYTFYNNTIYISVTMRPKYWRLRFKGSVGTLVGINPNGFHIFSFMYLDGRYSSPFNYFANQTRYIYMTVNSDGYTDYIVASALASCSRITIHVSPDPSTASFYYRYFDSNTLIEGESGCFTIPTSSDLHGWTKE